MTTDFWWIYALIEPRPNHPHSREPRYVGKAVDPDFRLKGSHGHLKEAKRGKPTRKYDWLRAVIEAGLESEIQIELLEYGIGDDTWPEAECRWIAFMREHGCDLTNGNGGGRGGINPSSETRMKISAANKGRPSPNKGKTWSDEDRAKISAGCSSPEAQAKWLAKMMGHPVSEETRAKIAASLNGHPAWNKGIRRIDGNQLHLF